MHTATRLRYLRLAMLVAASGFAAGAVLADTGDGWQVGDDVPSFYVRDVSSDRPNLATCLVCRYGARPVVLVCVHDSNAQTERVIVAIDRAVDEARGQGLRGFALYLSPRPGAVHSSLLRLARQGRFSLPLTLPVESGSPRDMSVPAGTSLTVLCYSDHKIVFRHVLPNEITDAHLSAVLADMKRLAE